MVKICCPVQLPAFPLRRIGFDYLRQNGAIPVFDDMLLGAHIVAMRQTGRKSSDETTLLCMKRCQHTLNYVRFHQHIVIEIQNSFSHSLFEQEIALFSDTMHGWARMPCNTAASCLNDAAQCLKHLLILHRLFALIGYDHMYVAPCLCRDARQRHNE